MADRRVIELAPRSGPDLLRRLLDRFRRFDAESAERLQALLAADYRLDLCAGAIVELVGSDEAMRCTNWPAGRLSAAHDSYRTARVELDALDIAPPNLPAEGGR